MSDRVLKFRNQTLANVVDAPRFGLMAEDQDHRTNIIERAERAAAVANQFAAAVDADARYPAEAMAAIRREQLLGIMVPRALGGEGASVAEIAEVCYILGRTCASTAMIYAMHQVKAACLIRHAGGQPFMEAFQRKLAREQLLLASSTTEGNNGGDVRSSAGAVAWSGGRITLDRAASVISYGVEADALVTTARRNADAAKSDQVLLVLLKDDYTLKQVGGWNAFGMRGTSSAGFQLHVDTEADRVLAVPYQVIHSQTMTPTAHIFWSSVWAGIASAALEKSKQFVRSVARKSGGTLPPGAAHMTRALTTLRMLRCLIADAIRGFEARADDADALGALDFQNQIVMLKVQASELALSVVMSAMRAGGLSAYRLDGEFSIVRQVRDILSAPIMIHNDRIFDGAVSASMLSDVPDRLFDLV